MAANARDLAAASDLAPPLRSRLSLSGKKLASVAEGLRQLAEGVVSCDVVREEVGRIVIGEGLELVQRKVPMGVVLVVFESRPDSLPQVISYTSSHSSGVGNPLTQFLLVCFCVVCCLLMCVCVLCLVCVCVYMYVVCVYVCVCVCVCM